MQPHSGPNRFNAPDRRIAEDWKVPSLRDLSSLSSDQLNAQWIANHSHLLTRLGSDKLPLLALHGSGDLGLTAIGNGDRTDLDAAMVLDAPDVTRKLFQLYEAALYVANYAFRLRGAPGAVLVYRFNPNMRGLALKQERLKAGGSICGPLGSDPAEIADQFKALASEANRAWRVTLWLPMMELTGEGSLDKAIRLEDLGEDYSKVAQDQPSGLGFDRSLYARRFLAQEILRQAFEVS